MNNKTDVNTGASKVNATSGSSLINNHEKVLGQVPKE